MTEVADREELNMQEENVIPEVVGHLLAEGFSTSETGFDASGERRWWLLTLDEQAWVGVVADADGEPVGRAWIAADDTLAWCDAIPTGAVAATMIAHGSPYWHHVDGIEFDESETARTWQGWLAGTLVTPGPALLAAMERFGAARAGARDTAHG